MLPLTDQDLKTIQDKLEWIMAAILLPIGLFNIGDDWLIGMSYIALAVILCPLTVGARWLKITIAFIALLIIQL
ncbi:hypothetical protein IQ250_06030 [Pseudanabaenaceae cyanobacterium LEGE 13415]|nr:hypothetical protein [Pseudanabaenaceae cyanobacterium LEGE 13415]